MPPSLNWTFSPVASVPSAILSSTSRTTDRRPGPSHQAMSSRFRPIELERRDRARGIARMSLVRNSLDGCARRTTVHVISTCISHGPGPAASGPCGCRRRRHPDRAGRHRPRRRPPRSGTGLPSVRAAATGTPTPATATTAACNSAPAPGARTAAAAPRPTPAAKSRSPWPSGSSPRRAGARGPCAHTRPARQARRRPPSQADPTAAPTRLRPHLCWPRTHRDGGYTLRARARLSKSRALAPSCGPHR